MSQYERIIRQCFWDIRVSPDELKQIITGNDKRQKKRVFEKILLNSTNFLFDLELFDRDELQTMLAEYSPPAFNHDHAFRRKNMAEFFFFNKKLTITELQWTV